MDLVYEHLHSTQVFSHHPTRKDLACEHSHSKLVFSNCPYMDLACEHSHSTQVFEHRYTGWVYGLLDPTQVYDHLAACMDLVSGLVGDRSFHGEAPSS